MNHAKWIAHFQRNREDRPEPDWGIGGTLWELQFRLLGLAAAAMLWVNHGRCLRALGARPMEFSRKIHRELSRFIWRLGRSAQVPASLPLSVPATG